MNILSNGYDVILREAEEYVFKETDFSFLKEILADFLKFVF